MTIEFVCFNISWRFGHVARLDCVSPSALQFDSLLAKLFNYDFIKTHVKLMFFLLPDI